MALGIDRRQILEGMEREAAMSPEEQTRYRADRTEALEDGLLVEYVEQCYKESMEPMRERRQKDEQHWAAYQTELPEYRLKEPWQSKVVLNNPFTSCYQAKALVRKAVAGRGDNYFDVQPTEEQQESRLAKDKAKFWKSALGYWARQGRFNPLFADMAEMGFVLGISLGAKLVWARDEHGRSRLRLMRVKPWHLHWDPDRLPREPQGGLFCIHEEWLDYHVLQEGARQGLYQNIDQVLREDSGDDRSFGWDERFRDDRRPDGVFNRNQFRKMVRVREFYGDLLNHNGELVLSKVRLMVANRTVIVPPRPFPLPTLRWPIHQFAPVPSLTKFHGMALVEGVLKLWKLQCNLLSGLADDLNYTLNTAFEVDRHKLVDPADTELYPGALKYRKSNQQGPAYQEIRKTPKTQDIAPIFDLVNRQFQNGSFVTELLKGEIGHLKTTATEIQLKTQQATGVFDSIGRDVELGGVGLLEMIHEVVATLWNPMDHPSYQSIVRPHSRFLEFWHGLPPEQRAEEFVRDVDIQIKGVSAILERDNLIQRILQASQTVLLDPEMRPMVDPQKFLRKYFEALDISDTIRPESEIEAQQAQMAQPPQGGAEGAPPGAGPPMDLVARGVA